MLLLAALPWLASGCYSIQNGWLDPTVLGRYYDDVSMEIRTSLTLEDTPFGIPGAVHPSREDLEVIPREYPITGGDTLAVEINELRERFVPYQSQVQVTPTGYVNLPIVGRVAAVGLTVPEFEQALRDALREKELIQEADVTVNALFLQKATYSIFGIGVSASNNAPLRAGTFPIRRPDMRVLEAINQVGGLSEFVTDIYVFRYDELPPTDNGAVGTPDAVTGPSHDSPEHEPEPEEASPRESAEDTPPTDAGAAASDELMHEQVDELMGAVLDEGGTDESNSALKEESSESLPDPLLEPEPTAPYLWLNGEFVPNPTFDGPARARGDRESAPFDGAAPAVNWARIAGESTYRVIRISADALRGGDPEANICIRAGDVIRIVSGEIGVYYVMGQVNRAGPFAFNAEPITLKAAIAMAGGLSPLAWPDRCTVYRRLGQREQMIQVNLDRVFAGKDPDFMIRRGDIINIGTHPFAPFLQRIRAMTLPNPTTTVGYAFTYARNFADVDSFAAQSNPADRPSRFPNLFP